MRRSLISALACVAGLSLAAATPAGAAPKPRQLRDVVVAHASPGENAYFPDVAKLDDGRLLAVYREGPSHAYSPGRIMMVESRDGGVTWSQPRVIIDSQYDDRDPKIMQTSDGTLLLNFFETDWSGSPAVLRGTHVARSTDGGRSWSEPVKIHTRLSCGCGPVVGAYRLGGSASHGEIVELPNGDLLAPLYGTTPDSASEKATVVRSTDGGRTWRESDETVIAAAEGTSFQEPVLARLKHGSLVALIRTPGLAYLSRSFDGGHTWTPPKITDMYASSAHLLVLRNGDVLATFGDISGRFSTGRPTVGSLITHPERSWDGIPDRLLYDAGNGSDQANPSSAEVAPGRFLTLTYDLTRDAIVGVFSRTKDYR